MRKSLSNLTVNSLEDRIAPAYAMAIDGDAPASVNITEDIATNPGTTIFSPNAAGAILDVDAIQAALTVGNVVITTGSSGSETGNITWSKDSTADDLDYHTAITRSLTIQTDATSTEGRFDCEGPSFNFSDNVNLTIDTTAPMVDGLIVVGYFQGSNINNARSITLNAGTADIVFNGPNMTAVSGDITLTAHTLANGPLPPGFRTVQTLNGDVTVNAAVDVALTLAIRATFGQVSLNGPVDAGNQLILGGQDIIIGAPIGATIQVNELTIETGTVSFGANSISAPSIEIGASFVGPAVLGAGTGTLNGDVTVGFQGVIAPGGPGTVGTLTINGNLLLQGSYAIDLEATSDRIQVSGNVTIDPYGRLGGFSDSGTSLATGDIAVVTFGGTLSGAFANVPAEGRDFVIADHPYQLTHYGPTANGITIAQAPAAVKGVAAGIDSDGTNYSVRLTGGGTLVAFLDENLQLDVFTFNTSIRSKLSIATKVNASDDVVNLGIVRINGALGSFNAPTANLNGEFVATGTVKSLAFANTTRQITLGGVATDRTTLKAEAIGNDVHTPGVLSSIATTGSFQGGLSAAAIGSFKVAGVLSGGGNWTVPGGVGSISAGEIQGVDLVASYIGSISTIGGGPFHLAGNLSNSTFRLTGNNGTKGKFGLKSLSVRATVFYSTFDVQEGNVSSFIVGRFIGSNLYLDYTPSAAPFAAQDFDSAAVFKLGRFSTTATPIGDLSSPLNWGFAGSQIAADTIGTMRLSGLKTDNGGTVIGIKSRTPGGSVQIQNADNLAIPLNTNLSASPAALANDFFFVDV